MVSIGVAYAQLLPRVLVLRALGACSNGSNIRYRVMDVVFWFLVAGSLVGIAALSGLEDRLPIEIVATYVGWILYACLAAGLVAILAHFLTQGFRRLTFDLDRLLSRRGHQFMLNWLRSSHKSGPQAVLSTLIAAALVAVATYSCLLMATPLALVGPLLVAVAICGFFVGGCLYWLIQGLWAIFHITRPGMLTLFPLAPGSTPGLEHFARLLGGAFASCAALSLVFLLPYASGALRSSAPSGTGLESSHGVRLLLLALAGVVTIAMGIAPQVWFTQAIQRARHQSLNRLIRKLDHTNSPSDRDRLRDEFAMVAQSPASTISADNVAQIAVAAAALTLPFFLGLLI